MKRMLFVCLVIAGCKQAKGERCQIETDCQSGLLCNQATMTCQSMTGGGIDATVPDGPRGDAGTDAVTDATNPG